MKSFFAIAICVLSACIVYAGPEWKLKKENDHLKVFSAEVENSSYKAVKVECVMKCNFSQFVAALFDMDRQKDWIYNDKYSKLLKQVKENELIYYSEVNIPWPASNRDFIAHMKVTQQSAGTVLVVSTSEPDFIPEKDGIVRIRSFSSQYTLTAIGSNQVKVEYILQLDPGGNAPAWLINLFVVKGPYESFETLYQKINTPPYQNVHFNFIKDM